MTKAPATKAARTAPMLDGIGRASLLPTVGRSAIIRIFDTRRRCLGEYKGEVS
jgi:hypothetical protein